MEIFVTFGQVHAHSINGKTFDKDCIAVIDAENHAEGRKRAFELFGDKFFTTYTDGSFPKDNIRFFPRGLIYVE